MFQPNLIQLLSNDHLEVKRGDDCCPSGNADTGRGGEGDPFAFTPQLLHLNKDHEFFEVKQQQLKDASPANLPELP